MSEIIYCPDPLPKKDKYWIFLMGPIQGAPDWQEEVKNLCSSEDIVFLNPRRKINPIGNEDKVFSSEDYAEQVKWETMGLRLSDAVLCWIPSPAYDIPGRQYAQTTRFELGENLARGKRVACGFYQEFPGGRYFMNKLASYHQPAPGNFLKGLVGVVEEWARISKSLARKWFTSDTHFGSLRALNLSQRPFRSVKDMDWKMIENWNATVGPWDNIYHLGDFGDTTYLPYLNGVKTLIIGNYEREELREAGLEKSSEAEKIKYFQEKGWDDVILDDFATLYLPEIPHSLLLSHEPLKIKGNVEFYRELGNKTDKAFGLFGHIHGKQKIKPWGMDVGVDANNFIPVGVEDIMFYKEAIEDNYYDGEVWS